MPKGVDDQQILNLNIAASHGPTRSGSPSSSNDCFYHIKYRYPDFRLLMKSDLWIEYESWRLFHRR